MSNKIDQGLSCRVLGKTKSMEAGSAECLAMTLRRLLATQKSPDCLAPLPSRSSNEQDACCPTCFTTLMKRIDVNTLGPE